MSNVMLLLLMPFPWGHSRLGVTAELDLADDDKLLGPQNQGHREVPLVFCGSGMAPCPVRPPDSRQPQLRFDWTYWTGSIPAAANPISRPRHGGLECAIFRFVSSPRNARCDGTNDERYEGRW